MVRQEPPYPRKPAREEEKKINQNGRGIKVTLSSQHPWTSKRDYCFLCLPDAATRSTGVRCLMSATWVIGCGSEAPRFPGERRTKRKEGEKKKTRQTYIAQSQISNQERIPSRCIGLGHARYLGNHGYLGLHIARIIAANSWLSYQLLVF